ncbi:hypothetical protein DMENIID0001_074710 [Sergentomyia squamirostris]
MYHVLDGTAPPICRIIMPPKGYERYTDKIFMNIHAVTIFDGRKIVELFSFMDVVLRDDNVKECFEGGIFMPTQRTRF